jgi:hypothetical protein
MCRLEVLNQITPVAGIRERARDVGVRRGHGACHRTGRSRTRWRLQQDDLRCVVRIRRRIKNFRTGSINRLSHHVGNVTHL